jgi:tetratricopeptide (TPR) repeat protein/tRNA A-37 threonylcarbamoyl transferase component Bud32
MSQDGEGGKGPGPTRLHPPVVGSRYRLDAELARGGMGVVYAATDLARGQRLAVKRLLPGADRRASHLFRREYHVLTQLRHPCIIDVLDFGTDAHGPYYTMELLEGADLQHLAPLPYREACRHLRDVASSLALLHARRLLHRDVSPRNIRLDAAGHAKLLDFGALASFGVSMEVVGTPPCVAPEALRSQPLDGRTDLYSLGAVAYRVLTGRHAYPTRTLRGLPTLWARPLAPPSLHCADVPPALDDLVLSLLSADPLGRPATAAEVMDRLGMVADLAPQPALDVAHSYLHAPQLVGREAEVGRIRRHVKHACQGTGSAVLIEGERGLGASRLLDEAAVQARLAGALVLRASATERRGPHAVLHALAGALLEEDADTATRVARTHGALLAPFVPELRAAWREEEAKDDFGERRARMHRALVEWMIGVCRERPLALVVDDVHVADEGSLSILAALALRSENHPLFIAAAARRDEPPVAPAMVRALRDASHPMVLGELEAGQVEALVVTLFGDVPHAQRLAHWAHRRAAGNPLHCMELARHLVDRGIVHYADGTWVIPHSLPAEEVPLHLEGALATRLLSLSAGARSLAEALSVASGAVSLEHCLALGAPAPEQAVFSWLDELIAKDILVGGDAFTFRHEVLKDHVARRLEPGSRQQIHRRIAELWLTAAGDDLAAQMEAAWHLLEGGEEERGADLVVRSGWRLSAGAEWFRPPSQALEAALRVYRRLDRPPRARLSLLALTTMAGWYGDRELVQRYGDQAIELGLEVTGLHAGLGRGPRMARALALASAMASAAVRNAMGAQDEVIGAPLAYRDLLAMLLTSAGYRAGIAASCLDVEGLQHVVERMEPLARFPRSHITRIFHDYFRQLLLTAQGREAEAVELGKSVFERLNDPRWEKVLGRGSHRMLLGGMLLSTGAVLAFEEQGAALEYARKLEEMDIAFYRTAVSQLRMLHHIYQGRLDLAQEHRREVEAHAVAGGSTWQTEMFVCVTLNRIHQMTGDIVALKQESERLSRIADEVPSLRRHADVARGCHLFLQGRREEAVALYEQALTEWAPRERIGWAAVRGNLARLLNTVGDHGRAEVLCREAMRWIRPEDRRFVSLYLEVEYQLALAEAGTGKVREAIARLEGLLLEFGDRGAVTVGKLHEARALIALQVGDQPAFDAHWRAMRGQFEATRNPALLVQCQRLAAEGARRFGTPVAAEAQPHAPSDAHTVAERQPWAHAERLRALLEAQPAGQARANRVLEWFLQATSASEAHLYLREGPSALRRVSFSTAVEPPRWVVHELRDALDRLSGQRPPDTAEVPTEIGLDRTLTEELRGDEPDLPREVCAIALVARRENALAPVGAVVLGSLGSPIVPPPRALVEAAAQALSKAPLEEGAAIAGRSRIPSTAMSQESDAKERRRAVRLRPILDLPAKARLLDGELELQVWDVSVGGLAVVDPRQAGAWDRDARHRIHLDLGRYGAFELDVMVRHRTENATGTVGMQIVDPPQEIITAMGRYVAELLERGAPS